MTCAAVYMATAIYVSNSGLNRAREKNKSQTNEILKFKFF